MPNLGKKEMYYVVNTGVKPGIYSTWKDCEQNVKGFKGAIYKKFNDLNEAKAFLKSGRKVEATPQKTITISQTIIDKPQPIIDKPQPIIDKPQPIIDKPQTIIDKPQTTIAKPQTTIDKKRKAEEISVVYTDGASSNNGKDSARAGYGVYWGENDPRNTSKRLKGPRQTNQRAEAMAVIHALSQSQDGEETLEIKTDSKYVINAATEWSKAWIKNEWKTSAGKEVENRDLFEEMLKLIDSRKGPVKFTYVPGHQGIEGNEKADLLAVKGAERDI